MSKVAIFGNSQSKAGNWDYDTAELVGKLLAQSGIDIITGGFGGVMESAMKGADKYPVEKIGVTVPNLPNRTVNSYVNPEIIADTYLQRTEKLIELADGYIIMPGGSGTLLELAAVWALKERGLLGNKPIVCLGELWLEVIQTMGFYSERMLETTDLIVFADTAQEAVEAIVNKLGAK
jgi:uncharacterized protein (TIGR00730 family)